MHYYQFHVSDYIHDTAHLSLEEDLAFRRLLDLYYTQEKPIPSKTHEVARRIRMSKHESAIQIVLEEFFMFDMERDCWTHKRCDETIAAYQAKAERNREIGKLGGRPKANHQETQTLSRNNPNQEPITINQKPIKEKVAAAPLVLPDWIPLETWQAFLEMRKKIKKSPTDKAVELLIAKLKKFKDAGQDVQAILEKSITSNWQDVFEIKENKTFAQQAADVARTTVPPAHTGPDPALVKIEADRQKAAPMPAHIRQQINQVLRKTA